MKSGQLILTEMLEKGHLVPNMGDKTMSVKSVQYMQHAGCTVQN